MPGKNLSLEEVENLSYYDFMSYLGASFFQLGGPKSMERLAESCQIDRDEKVLEVGCGSGLNACRIAQKFGCSVLGVDIAEVSVELARDRAGKEGLGGLVEFRVGDAYNLPFGPDTFDVVITGFVSQFFDAEKAFREFARVLRPGGLLGVNEMYKDQEIPPKEAEEIQEVEDLLKDLTRLPFQLHTPEDWRRCFEDAGFGDVQIRKSKEYLGLKDTPYIIREMGGWGGFLPVLGRMLKYYLLSKKIRNRFQQLQKVKAVFMRKRSTSRHVGYVLATGRKPLG